MTPFGTIRSLHRDVKLVNFDMIISCNVLPCPALYCYPEQRHQYPIEGPNRNPKGGFTNPNTTEGSKE